MTWLGARRLHYGVMQVTRNDLLTPTFMSSQASSIPRPFCLGSVPQAARKRVEEILEAYDHLRPGWCRAVAVELDGLVRGRGAPAVTAACVPARGEMAFTLPSDWLELSPTEQELSLVFWYALDDLCRGLSSTVGPVVDALRQADRSHRTNSEPASDLYRSVLPIIGSSALDLARNAVNEGPRRAA